MDCEWRVHTPTSTENLNLLERSCNIACQKIQPSAGMENLIKTGKDNHKKYSLILDCYLNLVFKFPFEECRILFLW